MTVQIPISVNGFKCFALVDTGSTITVASQAFSRRVGTPTHHQASAPHAVGLGGNDVQMAGAAFAVPTVGTKQLIQQVHFTKDECTPIGPREYNIILGNDFLSQLPRFSIDYDRSKFCMGDEVLPLGDRHVSKGPEVHEVMSREDVHIPPNSTQ